MTSWRVAGEEPARMAHEIAMADRLRRTVKTSLRGRERRLADADFLKRSHVRLEEAVDAFRDGCLDRRGFLRSATLLGVGATIAGSAVAHLLSSMDDVAHAETGSISPTSGPRAGGSLVGAMPVEAIGDPAEIEWVARANILRHQNEFLTVAGADNIVRPMLAEAWAASSDLMVWTFKLREGVFWRSGAEFEAQDVLFNIERWFDPAIASPNRALLASLSGPEAVEVLDRHTLRLNLTTPSLAIPESLFSFAAAIMPRSFDGDVAATLAKGELVDGTGAYALTELVPGEKAVLRHRRLIGAPAYWGARMSHIGPGWVDEIRYEHHETADRSSVATVVRGDAHFVSEIDVDAIGVEDAAHAGLQMLTANSSLTGCMRMRVDAAPFDNPKLRRAVQLACAPQRFPARVFGGRGVAAEHHHVAPIHPDYYPLSRPRRNVEKARALLAEAGFADGVDLKLRVGATSGAWEIRAAAEFAAQAAPAGLRVVLERVSAERYRRDWRLAPFGLTEWSHRPLGTMALALGYRSGAAWNETGYANPAFDAALSEAEALIDIRARRKAMAPVQRMLQDDAVMVQPLWAPILGLASERVRGLSVHPTRDHHFNNVWLVS